MRQAILLRYQPRNLSFCNLHSVPGDKMKKINLEKGIQIFSFFQTLNRFLVKHSFIGTLKEVGTFWAF